jgi:hypothetical protein
VFTARYALSPYIKQIRFVFNPLKTKRIFPAGKRPGTHFTWGWVGPRTGLDSAQYHRAPEFDPRTVQPVVVAILTELSRSTSVIKPSLCKTNLTSLFLTFQWILLKWHCDNKFGNLFMKTFFFKLLVGICSYIDARCIDHGFRWMWRHCLISLYPYT